MFRRILAPFAVLALVSLNFGQPCGAPNDVDAAQCCATDSSCQSETGVTDAKECCKREANSRTGIFLQTSIPRVQSIDQPLMLSLAAISQHTIEVVALLNERDLRAAPLKFPPRDLVKLYASLLI